MAQVLIKIFILENYEANLVKYYRSDVLSIGKIHSIELFFTELTNDDTQYFSKVGLECFAISNAVETEKLSVFNHLSKCSWGNITGMRL